MFIRQSLNLTCCLFFALALLSSCDDNRNKKKYVTKHANPREARILYPYITGDALRHFSDHVVDDTHIPFYPKQVKEKDVVFVKTKYLGKYLKHMHPRIKHPYILITGNGDEDIPGEFASLLDDDKILVWFGINTTVTHPKLVAMPIGGGYDTGTGYDICRQLHQMPAEKTRLVYLNFTDERHLERSLAKQYFSSVPFCTVDEPKPFEAYMKEIWHSKFNVSPRGNGIDCHRVWETILVGTIPILKSTPLDPLYEDMPVLIVKDWSDVTEELLEKKYLEITSKPYCLEKIYVDYWLKMIDTYRGRNQYLEEREQLKALSAVNTCLK